MHWAASEQRPSLVLGWARSCFGASYVSNQSGGLAALSSAASWNTRDYRHVEERLIGGSDDSAFSISHQDGNHIVPGNHVRVCCQIFKIVQARTEGVINIRGQQHAIEPKGNHAVINRETH